MLKSRPVSKCLAPYSIDDILSEMELGREVNERVAGLYGSFVARGSVPYGIPFEHRVDRSHLESSDGVYKSQPWLL